MRAYTLEQQMARFGIPETEQGPYCTELRAMVQRKLDDGLIYMSAGTNTDEFYALDYEGQAKARLAFEWSIERQHSYRQEVWDRIVYWSTDTRTMKRRLVIRWWSIPDWIGDRFRELGMHYRVWRDRKLVNPYR